MPEPTPLAGLLALAPCTRGLQGVWSQPLNPLRVEDAEQQEHHHLPLVFETLCSDLAGMEIGSAWSAFLFDGMFY